jgi:hypothetical protein
MLFAPCISKIHRNTGIKRSTKAMATAVRHPAMCSVSGSLDAICASQVAE